MVGGGLRDELIGRLSLPGSVLAARPPESLAARLVPQTGCLDDAGQQNSGADSSMELLSSHREETGSLNHPKWGDAFALSRGGMNPQNTETVDVTVLHAFSIMGGRLVYSACSVNMFC